MGTQSADIKRINKRESKVLELWNSAELGINAWLTLWLEIAIEIRYKNATDFLERLVAQKVRHDANDDDLEVTPKDKTYKRLMKSMSKWKLSGEFLLALALDTDKSWNGDKAPSAKQKAQAIRLVKMHVADNVEKPFEPLSQYRLLVLNKDGKTFNKTKVTKVRDWLSAQCDVAKMAYMPQCLNRRLENKPEAKRVFLAVANGFVNEEGKIQMSDPKFKTVMKKHKLEPAKRQPDPDKESEADKAKRLKKEAEASKAKAEAQLEKELSKFNKDMDRVSPIIANLKSAKIALEKDARGFDDLAFKELQNAVDDILEALELAEKIRASANSAS